MAKLPKRNGTIHLIDDRKYGQLDENSRGYLGMSGIGDECWRKIWYGFHWASEREYKARMQRIFDVGHLFEEIAINDLKSVGCTVFALDENGNSYELTGKKSDVQETLHGFAGHAKGHPDGRIIGLQEYPNEELLLELKTMKAEKFVLFKQKGVAVSHPAYYAQAQKYMGKMDLKKCFFLAINKNTCEYWWEFIDFDREYFNELERKEKVIIISDEPPEMAYSSNNYNCNFCNHYATCHAKVAPDKNCRTCDYSDLADNGEWHCGNSEYRKSMDVDDDSDLILGIKTQITGCEFYKLGWGM